MPGTWHHAQKGPATLDFALGRPMAGGLQWMKQKSNRDAEDAMNAAPESGR